MPPMWRVLLLVPLAACGLPDRPIDAGVVGPIDAGGGPIDAVAHDAAIDAPPIDVAPPQVLETHVGCEPVTQWAYGTTAVGSTATALIRFRVAPGTTAGPFSATISGPDAMSFRFVYDESDCEEPITLGSSASLSSAVAIAAFHSRRRTTAASS